MFERRLIVMTLISSAAACCAYNAQGQSAQSGPYPSKPIRIITSQAGGGGDLGARVLAQAISGPLGYQVVVDNRSSATNSEAVARSAPDGYTLLFNGSALWLAPFLQANLPYDPVKDFTAITIAVSTPDVLVVHPSLPVKSVKELIALAKAKPGVLNWASGPTGTTPHLSGELFKAMGGVNFVRVNYQGGGSGLNDIISGEVQLMFPLVSSGLPHVKSGRLRALAVTSAHPSALAPGLSPIAAALPGYEAVTMFGVFAPAKTPAAIITRLNQEIVRALNTAEVKQRYFTAGVEIVGTTPEQAATMVNNEIEKWGKVIRGAGIKPE